MVVRRPKSPSPQPNQDDEQPDLELMEHLVKKSLDVNPAMRHGKRTGEVLKKLKDEAISRSKHGNGAEGAPRPRASLAERRKSTISFFFEQKAEEFDTEAADIAARLRRLESEKKELQSRVTNEIIDFLALMSGGADTPEARGVMRYFRNFLNALGISDADIVQGCKRRQ